jgi:hypothetical protein
MIIYRYKDLFIKSEGRGLNHYVKYGSRFIIYPLLKFSITIDHGIYLLDLNNLFLKYGESIKFKLSQLLASGDIFTDKDIMSYLDTKLGFRKFIISLNYSSTPKKLTLGNINLIKSIYIKERSSFTKPHLDFIVDANYDRYDFSRLTDKKLPGKSLLDLIFDLSKLEDYCSRKKENTVFKTLSTFSDQNYCISEYSQGLMSLILTLRLCKERNKNYLRI